MLSPTPLPTNGIQDSIQSAAALAGITDDDALDEPSLEPTLPATNTNNNQSSNAVPPQANFTSSQPVQNASVAQPLFNIKTNQLQPATSFITSTATAPAAAPASIPAAAAPAPATAPIQTLQPVSNITPQVNSQPIQPQQQSTITLPQAQAAGGGSVQLSLTPQQIAALQQGGRIIQSGNTIQIVPNQLPQAQIVQGIQPNGTPIQLALIPSNPFGQHVIIRPPLKAGTKVANQVVGSPSRNPPNIQPKLTTAGQVTKPVNIRPYQVLAPQQISSVASTVAQPSIVLQQPTAAGAPAAQTLQLANLAQPQPTAVAGSQNVILHNQVSGVPVVTMGVSRGSIIVMSRPSTTTTSQPQQLAVSTVNSSTTKPSLAPAPSTTAEINPKPAPKKKNSKKKKKDEKSKPPTTTAAATTAAVSVTQSVTTLTTSTAGQQTAPAVTYAQQTFVTSNGQTIVVQPPIKQGAGGGVPIVQQVNLASLPQGAVSQIQPAQQQGSAQLQQVGQQQYRQVTMTSSTGQQIIANIPQPQNSTQMTPEQQQQYLIQAIKLQQQRQQKMPAQSPQQILPAAATTSTAANLQTNQNFMQHANSRQTPSPRPPPPSAAGMPQVQLGQSIVQQSGVQIAPQTGQNQLQTMQNQLQSVPQNQLQTATQNQLQGATQNQMQATTLNQLQVGTQNQLQAGTQNQIQAATQNQVQGATQNQLQATTQNQLQATQNQLQGIQNQLQIATNQQNNASPAQKQEQQQVPPGQNPMQQVIVQQSNQSSLQPQSVGGVVLNSSQQQLQLTTGAGSQSVQNQVQLVSSSQAAVLKVGNILSASSHTDV